MVEFTIKLTPYDVEALAAFETNSVETRNFDSDVQLFQAIYIPPKTWSQKLNKVVSKFVDIDSKINEIKPTALGILSFVMKAGRANQIFDIIKSKSEYIGILNLLQTTKKVFSGKIFEERTLRAISSILKVASKAIEYTCYIPLVFSSHPYVLTAYRVSKIASRLGIGASVALSSVNKGTELYASPEKRVWNNYFALVGLAAISYVIVAPVLLTAPPVLAFSGLVGHVTMGSLFASDVVTALFYKNVKPQENTKAGT